MRSYTLELCSGKTRFIGIALVNGKREILAWFDIEPSAPLAHWSENISEINPTIMILPESAIGTRKVICIINLCNESATDTFFKFNQKSIPVDAHSVEYTIQLCNQYHCIDTKYKQRDCEFPRRCFEYVE